MAAPSDRLVRSYHLFFKPFVFIDLFGGTPVANCTTVHHRSGLNPAKSGSENRLDGDQAICCAVMCTRQHSHTVFLCPRP
jgi:hypothetical protein